MTLKLPETPKKANNSLQGSSILIFGPDKCGKTSFAAQFPNHFMLECNPGNANHINRNSVDVPDWDTLFQYFNLLASNPNYCDVIIIDELHRMYTYCYRYVRKKLRMSETEKDDFDVWRTVRNLFSETLDHVKKLGKTTIILCNEDVVEVSMGGRDVKMLDINLNNQGRDVMHGYALMRARIDYSSEGGRILQLSDVKNVNIGYAFTGHFMWKGAPLTEINLGSSPEIGYQNFIKAYNNELPGKTLEQNVTKPKLSIKS